MMTTTMAMMIFFTGAVLMRAQHDTTWLRVRIATEMMTMMQSMTMMVVVMPLRYK